MNVSAVTSPAAPTQAQAVPQAGQSGAAPAQPTVTEGRATPADTVHLSKQALQRLAQLHAQQHSAPVDADHDGDSK